MRFGKYRNICQVTQIALGFLVLYCAFNSSQNIQSIILQQDGFGSLGFYSIGVQALFQALGSMMSTGILNKLGLRPSMVIGGLMNSLWVLQGIIPALKNHNLTSDSWFFSKAFYDFVNILTSAVSGFCGCLLWVGEGQYISNCATEETKGFYFSYFWMFYMQSQVFGNLIAAMILGKFDQVTYFAIMSTVAFLASISFGFLRAPYKVDQQQSFQEIKPERISQVDQQDFIEINRSNFTSNNTQIVSITSLVQPQPQPPPSNFLQDIKGVWKMAFTKRLRYFLPQLLWIGMSIAISTLLIPIITLSLRYETDNNTKNSKAMFAMVAFGVGEVFGGMIIGQVVDRVNSKVAALCNCAFVLITTGLTLLYLYWQEYNWFVFLMAFMWGLQDGSVNTHCLEMLGFEFDNNVEPFSIFSLFESVTVFVFSLIQSLLKDEWDYAIYICVSGIAGGLMCGTTYFFDFKERRAHVKK